MADWETQSSSPGAAGTFNPVDGIFSEAVPEGSQVLFLRGLSRAIQTSTSLLREGTETTVSFSVGWRNDEDFNTVSARAVATSSGDVLGSIIVTALDVVKGEFTRFSYTFRPSAIAAGQTLTIVFDALNAAGQANIDDVTVETVAYTTVTSTSTSTSASTSTSSSSSTSSSTSTSTSITETDFGIVLNPSFENSAIPSGQTFVASIASWTITGFAGTYVPSSSSYSTIPDGTKVAYVRARSSISQVVPLSLRSDVAYTLRVSVGRRADQSVFPNGAIRVISTTSQTSLAVDLISPATVINGAFVEADVVFTAPPSTNGESMTIILETTGASGQINFDVVTLSARNI